MDGDDLFEDDPRPSICLLASLSRELDEDFFFEEWDDNDNSEPEEDSLFLDDELDSFVLEEDLVIPPNKFRMLPLLL